MKIWLMNHYATSMYRDKAGRHYWFAKYLKKIGHEATVFCATTFLDNGSQIDTGRKLLAVKRADDIPFVFVKTIVSYGNGMDRVRNMTLFYKNLFPAARAYAKKYGSPDIIIASSVHPLTMAAGIQIARRMKIPCICEIRDLWPEAIFTFGKVKEKSLPGRLLTAGEHWIYRNADALIFTKEGDTDYLKEKRWTTEQGGDIDLAKCHYINNGVDLRSFQERMQKQVFHDADIMSDDTFRVVYAGTIRPINHVGNLLDAAKLIQKRLGCEDVRFLIFGDGAELPKLRERVKREHIDNVKLKGFVDRRHIPFILGRSSVNILNYSQSQYNWSRGNSSNKLFEYMASGKPVISTVRMGYDLIERYRCGISLEEDTPECLAEAVLAIRGMDPGSYHALCAASRRAAADFDFGVLTEKLIKVIESV